MCAELAKRARWLGGELAKNAEAELLPRLARGSGARQRPAEPEPKQPEADLPPRPARGSGA